MKVLIVYGHPEIQSGFCYNILRSAEKFLQEKGVQFETLDLYKMGYNPILKEDELYTAGQKNVSEENLAMQEKIRQADSLVFIYPVWWGGMPAVLKGFMDRVFTPGFAFKYRKEKLLNFIPDKLLPKKPVAVFITYGGPGFAYKILLSPVKMINRFVIFGLFSSRVKIFEMFRAGGPIDVKRAKKIEKLARKGMGWLLNKR